jgi:hypothetical protein
VADHTDDDEAVVRQAVEALLSIGCWGLHDSHRSEVWVLAKRAKQVLDGSPMTEEEAADFRHKTERFLR